MSCWILVGQFLYISNQTICFIFCSQAGSRTIDLELTTLSSTNHVELSPSDAGFQDRYIVQEIIKEMAKNRPIDTKGRKGYKGSYQRFTSCHSDVYILLTRNSGVNLLHILKFFKVIWIFFNNMLQGAGEFSRRNRMFGL